MSSARSSTIVGKLASPNKRQDESSDSRLRRILSLV
jgi:hypothetical protein